MQDQSTTTAGRRPSGTAPSTMYDSAAMERQVRQVKGSGIMAPAQVIGNRIKPGSMSNPHQQNRSGVGAAAVGGVTSNQVLKCPRCNSLNTKFCYYNNYSLLQPRHFCKNCRRYWTKGGALRNVPVGGGCRKNKRTAATVATSGSGTSAVTAVLATATTMTTSSPGSVTKQGSMNMMMIRENSASCRNSSMSAVHKAALQESMPPAITYTNFPSLYSYTSKNGQIQPANSLSNPAASFYNPTDQSNPTQYPLLNPRLSPFLPPNQASFHSFLSLKQAISSLAAPNHELLSFNPSLTPTSALPFLSNDHHNISTANLDAAFHVPSNDPLMGLDLINASTTAPLVPLSSVTTTHSTTSASYSAAQSSSLALPEGFNHTNDLANRRRDHQLDGILHDTNDHKMNARYIKNQQELLQPFGSSSSAAGARVMQEMHAAASTGMQDMHAGMREMHAGSVEAMQDMHGAAAAIMEEGHQLMQLMSSSSMKDELVSDNFKMKGDNEDDINQSAGARGTNVSWEGTHRSSFLEASGDDQVYWSCNPTTWPDDLST